MKKYKTVFELRDILIKIQSQELNIVLVGGQAVNYWAYYYLEQEPQLNQYLPFASEDIDFYGGRVEAVTVHELLGGEIKLNRDFSPSPNTGVILVPYQNQFLRIDFLGSVFGLSDTDILDSAIKISGQGILEGINLKVINPLLCLEGKLKSLIGLPQQGRQDLKHLKISILTVKQYLNDICKYQKPRLALKLIERIVRSAISDYGLQVWLQYGIKIESCIPFYTIESFKNEDEKWSKLLEFRLPQIINNLSKKRTKYQSIIENRQKSLEEKHE